MLIKDETSSISKRLIIKVKSLKNFLYKKRNKFFLSSLVIGGIAVFFVPIRTLPKIKISLFGNQASIDEILDQVLPDNSVFEGIYNKVKNGKSLANTSYRFISSNIFLPAERMQINMKLDDYQILLRKRNQALKENMLIRTKDDEVNADINFKGKIYKVKVRLKGDYTDHLKDDKWSFRVKVRGDKSILGMKEFSLQHPRSRNYFYEYVFHRILKEEGVPSLRYDFIDFSLNGKKFGIYAIEEHFDKILIENNGFREGPILKFSEDELMKSRKDTNFPTKDLFFIFNTQINTFNPRKIKLNKSQLSQFFLARKMFRDFLDNKLTTSEVFDIHTLSKYIAISDFLNAKHNFIWHNLRFYFNPITSRLVPIGFDAQPTYDSKNITLSIDNESKFLKLLFKDEDFTTNYNFNLERISKKSYLNTLKVKLEKDFSLALKKLNMSYPFISFDIDYLRLRQELLRKRLALPLSISSDYYKNHEKLNQLEITLANNSQFPIEILEVINNGAKYVPLSPLLMTNQNNKKTLVHKNFFFKTLNNQKINNLADNFLFRYKILGTKRILNQELNLLPFTDSSEIGSQLISRRSNSKDFKFLIHDHPNKLIKIKKGDWSINNPLILPVGYGLFADSRTTLIIEEGAFIFINGPLNLIGSTEEPILIKGGNGIVIANAINESKIENVIFSNLSSPSNISTTLTSGINFFNSPVSIKKTSFIKSQSEDAINLFRSDFKISSSKFEDINSDALDIDFSDGIIKDTTFNKIENDAVDVSGSNVSAINLTINEVLDKAFSAGEQSKLNISDSYINKASIGVASKDLSYVEVKNTNFKNVELCLTSYQKKPEYGGASLITSNSKFQCDEKYLLEASSDIKVDSMELPINTKNVSDLLYGADYGKASDR